MMSPLVRPSSFDFAQDDMRRYRQPILEPTWIQKLR
jgi:hypothetical protein